MHEHKRERKAVGVNSNQSSALENLKASRREGRKLNSKKVRIISNKFSMMFMIQKKIKTLAPKMMETK